MRYEVESFSLPVASTMLLPIYLINSNLNLPIIADVSEATGKKRIDLPNWIWLFSALERVLSKSENRLFQPIRY